MDFFMRKNCSNTNDLRVVNSVSNEMWLSQRVVGAESSFSIPMSLVGVCFQQYVASVDVVIFHI